MQQWRRYKAGAEWGFFFGVISWLLSTGFSNDIPALGVWGIILSRTLMGFLIGIVQIPVSPWLHAALLSLAVNVPAGIIAALWGAGWARGFWPMILSGAVFAVCIEVILNKKKYEENEEQQ